MPQITPRSNRSGKVFIIDHKKIKQICIPKPKTWSPLTSSPMMKTFSVTMLASFTMPARMNATGELHCMNNEMEQFSAKAKQAFASNVGHQVKRSAPVGMGMWLLPRPVNKTMEVIVPRTNMHCGETSKAYESTSSFRPAQVSNMPCSTILELSKSWPEPWMMKPVNEKFNSPLMVRVVAKITNSSTWTLRQLKASMPAIRDNM
mmetsp:Transcript_4563/g.11470  ORF Transcript_4563/g.11470 Transcript_4563/m.11470 type:complete len:204 (+) Transcript_4563:218-829(+)